MCAPGCSAAHAAVGQVKANGLVVFVPKFGIEGPVYLVAKDAVNNQQQQYILDEEKQTVMSADGRTRFTVFDKCAVRISVEEGASHRWALDPVDPPGQQHKSADAQCQPSAFAAAAVC